MAFGRLRLRPVEFYGLTWEEYTRMREGYYEELDDYAAIVRIPTTVIANLFAKKPVTPEKFWPLPSDKKRRKASGNEINSGPGLIMLAAALAGMKDKNGKPMLAREKFNEEYRKFASKRNQPKGDSQQVLTEQTHEP